MNKKRPPTSIKRNTLLITIAILFVMIHSANAFGQNETPGIRLVRVIETDDFYNTANLMGIVYPPRANTLLVLDKSKPAHEASLVFLPPDEYPSNAKAKILDVSDPINITIDNRRGRLFFFDNKSNEIGVIKLHGRIPNLKTIERFDAREFDIWDPRGMAVDSNTGTVFVLDGSDSNIIRLGPESPGSNPQTAALDESRVSRLPIQRDNRIELRGLAFDSTNNCLYVYSPPNRALYKVDKRGRLTRVGTFSGAAFIQLKGLLFAPSLDGTDDPEKMSLFTASSGDRSDQVSEWTLSSAACIGGQ